jgi:hypothetical protein
MRALDGGVDGKRDAMKAAFFDLQVAMTTTDHKLHGVEHIRDVRDAVQRFERKIKEYFSAEDAVVLAEIERTQKESATQ